MKKRAILRTIHESELTTVAGGKVSVSSSATVTAPRDQTVEDWENYVHGQPGPFGPNGNLIY
jgi:hypothetical protein